MSDNDNYCHVITKSRSEGALELLYYLQCDDKILGLRVEMIARNCIVRFPRLERVIFDYMGLQAGMEFLTDRKSMREQLLEL